MDDSISVVIPCHNDELWVADAIRSCLEQTLKPKEIIVVDDGSSDGSRQILHSFENLITLIETPQRGACSARNTGWEHAQSKWIQFLDADDLLHPEKLEIHHQIAIKAPRNEISYCSLLAVNAISGEFMYETSHPETASMMERVLLEPIGPLMPLFSTDSLKEVGGFRANLPCMQDKDLNFRLWEAGYSFVPFSGTLTTARRRQGSVSSNTARCYRQYPLIYQNIIENTCPRQKEVDMQLASRLFAHASRFFAKTGDWDEAKRFHEIAEKLEPAGLNAVYGPLTKRLLDIAGIKIANLPLRFLTLLKN